MQRIGTQDGLFLGGNPATNTKGTVVTAAWLNAVQEELAQAVVGLGGTLNPADNGQLLNAMLILQQSRSANAGGTADAITATYTPSPTALANGMLLFVRASAANTTTTPTFSPNGLAAKIIVKGAGGALVAGDIAGAGQWLGLQYNQTLDKWVLLNPATGASTVTAANDPTYADNSTKPASTGWIRGAMSAIATAAGFAVSLTSPGYIKLPSWLGGVIFQWGLSSSSGSADVTVTFPIAYPTACRAVISIATPAGLPYFSNNNSETQTNFKLAAWVSTTGARFSIGCYWLSVGY